MIEYLGKDGENIQTSEIPDEYKEQAELYRSTLIDQLADCDEEIEELYLNEEEITNDMIYAAIRR